MQWFIYLSLFILSFGLSLVLVPLVRRTALRFDIVDKPGQRKVHSTARPLLGGLGFIAAFFVVVPGGLLAMNFLDTAVKIWPNLAFLQAQSSYLAPALPKLAAFFAGAALLVMIGVIDDLKGERFPYQLKFLAQFAAAAVVVAAGIRTSFLPYPWMNQALSIIWIVGIANAFNLLDNMDGLSAGIAIISGSIFFYLAAEQAQFFAAVLLITFVGAVAGFLRYNFYPAKIFMGDTGSLFLGFFLAVTTLSMSYVVQESSSLMPVTVIVPLLVLSLPVFDTLSVMAIRWREKRPLFQGDKRHFSHRLVDFGMSQRGAVVFIYLVAISIGVGASFLPYLPGWAAVLVLLQTAAIYAMITILMITGSVNRQS